MQIRLDLKMVGKKQNLFGETIYTYEERKTGKRFDSTERYQTVKLQEIHEKVYTCGVRGEQGEAVSRAYNARFSDSDSLVQTSPGVYVPEWKITVLPDEFFDSTREAAVRRTTAKK